MGWIDITLPLDEHRACWPGDQPFRLRREAVIGSGGGCNLSSFSCSAHIGTHVDAPYHYRIAGRDAAELDLDLLIGGCLVVELRGAQLIEAADLAGLVPAGTARLLVKTGNSRILHDTCFHQDYAAFSEGAVGWLLDRGVRLLGIDYYSIGPFGEQGERVHELFFSNNNTVALEGLDLSGVLPGNYQLVALPMKIVGGDGAPARVLLSTDLKVDKLQ